MATRIYIFFGLYFLLSRISLAQEQPANGTINFDTKLFNSLFLTNKTISDSFFIEIGKKEYFNASVDANCITSGDFIGDTLVFCNCTKASDTLFIEISSPVICCTNQLNIKVYDGKFTSSFTTAYDISPVPVLMQPIKQKLTFKKFNLEKNGNIQGHIYFSGRGNYQQLPEKPLTKLEKEKVFASKVEGYFKCTLNKTVR